MFRVVLYHTLQMKEVDDLQAEFIYEHVEGAKAVADTRVGSVGIHDYVGVVRGQARNLIKSLHSQQQYSLVLFRCAIWSFLSTARIDLQQEAKMRTQRQNIKPKLCKKKPGAHLSVVVNHKLWCGQLWQPVPHMPVYCGCWVVIVAH